MATKINLSQACLDVLRRSTITATTVTLPPEQLDPKLYKEVDKALRSAGGKWDRKSRAHLFTKDPRVALEQALTTGAATNRQQVQQAFYTPVPLARRMAAMAELQPGATLLEPSCGHGALILAALAEQPKLLVVAYDNDPDAVAWVKDRSEEPDDLPIEVECRDFLKVDPAFARKADRVIMNAPFTKQQDIDHVTHALEFLRLGGILVAIMGPSWQSSRTKKANAFRSRLESYTVEVEQIPAGTFKASGTGVASTLLKISTRANT